MDELRSRVNRYSSFEGGATVQKKLIEQLAIADPAPPNINTVHKVNYLEVAVIY